MAMSKKRREVYFWAIPWLAIAVMTAWSAFDQRNDINANTGNIQINEDRIAAHEAVVVIDARDRFTMSNFEEWVHAFMEANPDVTCPHVDFSPPPPAQLPVELLEK